jgi:hypothetical protein
VFPLAKFSAIALVITPAISPSDLPWRLSIIEYLHWRSLLAKLSATATWDSHMTVTTVLALATLAGATQIESNLFYVTPPKVANANTVVTVT